MNTRILLLLLVPQIFSQCGKTKNNQVDNVSRQNSAAAIVTEATLLNVKTLGNADTLKKAISMLDEAIALDSLNMNAYNYKAEYLTKLGDIQEANTVLDQALELYPHNPFVVFTKGLLCEKAGLKDSAALYYQQSINLFTDSIQSKPNDFGLIFNRAFVYVFVDSLDQAVKDFTMLQSKYDTTSKEYTTVSLFLEKVILNFDQEKFVREFWTK
ncbi:MAG: tetratricopeptide repeat protein [Tannerellaceae bacterium]